MAAGEKAAFPDCIASFGDLVWSLARRMTRSPADAEDAVQDIFLSVWQSAGRYDPARGSEATFIAAIARRTLIDRYRRSTRRVVEVPLDPPGDERDSPAWSVADPQAEGGGERASEAAQAVEALRELRPEQQQVLALAMVDGLSQSEIATRLSMPLGTVKSFMRRGLLAVRARLTGEGS